MATDIPWITTNAEAWDTLLIGPPGKQQKLPGLAAVTVKASLQVEKKKAKGKKGGSLVIHGLEPATVEITLRIWTKAQHEELNRLFYLIEPRDKASVGTGAPEPSEIGHPATTRRGVSALTITSLEGPNVTKGPFEEYKISATQHLPEGAKVVGGTVKARTGAVQADLDDLIRAKARVIGARFVAALKVPRTQAVEEELQAYQNQIDVLDQRIRQNQALLYNGNLPPTAPQGGGIAEGKL